MGRQWVMVGFWLVLLAGRPFDAPAAAQSEPQARTESSCNFGMVKGEARRSCRVPVPPSCTVANFPGTSRPWSNISKGGGTQCRFDDKETDWKSRITGTCERCMTGQCSARFAVVFDCSNPVPPAAPGSAPPRKKP
jgi:hypothetical protein